MTENAEAVELAATDTGLAASLEAVLMVADLPVPLDQLASVLGQPEARVHATLIDLAAGYVEQGRGFVLRDVGHGWRFYSDPTYAPAVEAFVRDGQTARLTKAALETLAVIAYRQPVARGPISAIRGVNVDGVIRTLVTRGLIDEADRDPQSGAILYQTTPYFLERLGLQSLSDLPPLAPFLPDLTNVDDMMGTEL